MKKMELRFNFNLKRALIWLVVILLFVPGILGLIGGSGVVENIPISQAVSDIKEGKTSKVEVKGDQVVLYYPDENGASPVKITQKEPGTSFVETLQRDGVDTAKVSIDISSQALSKLVLGFVSLAAPILGFGLFRKA